MREHHSTVSTVFSSRIPTNAGKTGAPTASARPQSGRRSEQTMRNRRGQWSSTSLPIPVPRGRAARDFDPRDDGTTRAKSRSARNAQMHPESTDFQTGAATPDLHVQTRLRWFARGGSFLFSPRPRPGSPAQNFQGEGAGVDFQAVDEPMLIHRYAFPRTLSKVFSNGPSQSSGSVRCNDRPSASFRRVRHANTDAG